MSKLAEFETQLSEPIYEPSVRRVFAAFKEFSHFVLEVKFISAG